MEYRTFNLTIVSATDLKKPRFTTKSDIYAVAFISGTIGKPQKQRTNVHKNSDSDPTWNFPMKFLIDEAAGVQNRLTLVIKIKAVGFFGGRNMGEVHVPVKELLDGLNSDKKMMQRVSYQVRRSSGKLQGVLNLCYEFGEKIIEPVTAYPPGYGYPPQAPPVYGGYPPQTVVQPPRRQSRMGSSGMGFGTGLLGGALGGLMLGEIMSGGGGGCGGGGCGGGGGGGCGGGGCGGGGCGGGGCGGGGCGGL
ncbi:hypothetical protein QVD17_01783 [Tagetes erecta]|uniref:C2 domain-containing protein n=1 Tax=Tagetes erecta TaxID=13708 RepID=A0AAD8P759_TARER|nr:hypothetical protein QVD17_01783 [Tagetes erecta]